MTQFYKKCDRYLRFGEATLLKKTGIYPYFHQITGEQNPIVQMDGNKVIMLGSNNYLGMTSHPKVKEAAQKAIEEYGVGTTGSRLLNGTMEIHLELERRLANFFGTEDCLVFSTGMQANLGAISAMISEKDEYILSDQQNHASIIDGIKLARMDSDNKKIYKHNDMEDLEKCLKEVPKGKGLIITDGVFSMEGDIVKLDVLADLAEDNGAGIYVDDAHAVGVIGPHGRGTAAHFDLVDRVGITMGTFSKSFATIGGYIAGSKAVTNWLKHKARSFIFSASPPPANCATVMAVLDIIEKDESYRKNVLSVAGKVRDGLRDIGFNVGDSSTAIVPLMVGERRKTMKFFKELYDHKPLGIFSNPVVHPATAKGEELIRSSYIATMTEEIVGDALQIFEEVGRKMKII